MEEEITSIVADQPKAIRRFVEGGKRVRPKLLLLSFEGYGGKSDVKNVAASLEILHAALLIHDDIMDGSLVRRGRPALHVEIGTPYAVVYGDMLLMRAVSRVMEANMPAKARNFFLTIIQKTIEGQILDVKLGRSAWSEVTEEGILEMYQLKTASYTFALPLCLGAYLAGRGDEVEKLHAIARDVGIAFQLRDDILGVFGDTGKTGKDVVSDIEGGKKTLLLKLAGVGGLSKSEEIRELVRASGALAQVEKKIAFLSRRALQGIVGLDMADQGRQRLAVIVNRLENRAN